MAKLLTGNRGQFALLLIGITTLNFIAITNSAVLSKRATDGGKIYFETDEIVLNRNKNSAPVVAPEQMTDDVVIRFGSPMEAPPVK